MNKRIWDNKALRYIYYNLLPFSLQAFLSKFIFRPSFGESMTICKGQKTYYGKVKFGRGVRISKNSIFSNIIVGNYTVFAEHFRMYVAHHDYTAFSVNDIFNQRIKKKYKINGLSEELKEPNEIGAMSFPPTVIGSDVWIGEYVTMKPGIKVGDGAIIAGGSIVTHDVEPFSIVGGVPARFIKWRFDEDTRNFLMQLKWWDWPEEKIAANYERLCKFDRSLLAKENEKEE